jgi:MinD-like ATPase involved in chromosome partitioning or flagellar assembly
MAGKSKVASIILEKASPIDQFNTNLQEDKLLYSIFGFIPTTDFTDNAILISNLGYALSQQDFNVCVVDFKVFYPNLYLYLDVPQNNRGNGLLTVLKDDMADLREEIKPTKNKGLYLLSPSPQDLMEEYFDFSMDRVSAVIGNLKKYYDIVLIDIPNNPPLEFCLGAMKQSHMGFFTASERIDALSNIIRLLDFADSVGVSVAKFTNIIFMNVQEIKYDFNMLKKMQLNIIAGFPLIKGVAADALEGKLYIRDNPVINSQYKKQLAKIMDMIMEQN